MCGISGIFHFASEAPVLRQSLEQMSFVQQHRGPDGAGLHLAERIGLANRRLAIVDRPHGQQPMANADGSLWITYNGEIFNYRELRSDLEQRGYRFCTTSDTEVILQAYAAHGAQAVAHLNGQFAFAIWDQRQQQLFLARDRLGIVPLHFAVRDGCFFFASEAKGILAHPDMRLAVDEEGMLQALLCSTPLIQRTLFQGIDSLPPGHFLTVNAAGVGRQQYWSLPLAPEAGDGRPAHWYKERIWAVLEDAVHLRLIGEVPVGVLLSGGTDSSTIAKLASRFLPQPLQTFTIDFPNAWKGDGRDASYTALMAQTLSSLALFLARFRPQLAASAAHLRFLTPDLGRFDADGTLFLLGRIDEVINRGGQKVNPEEVEGTLCQHPAVAAAAVFAVTDPGGVLGEVVQAIVVCHPGMIITAQQLIQDAATRLEPYKVPRSIEFAERLLVRSWGKCAAGRFARKTNVHREINPEPAGNAPPPQRGDAAVDCLIQARASHNPGLSKNHVVRMARPTVRR